MAISTVPPPPRQSNYGWSLADRKEEFKRLAEQTSSETTRIADFKGRAITLPIYRVPVNLPKYRIVNGRTASAQQEYVARQKLQPDFFDAGDPEVEELQQAQHKILMGMIREEGLLNKFKESSNKQVEPIMLDEHGYVVNGNRRLCCWRELYWAKPDVYEHFSHIDVVVLPHCDDKELDKVEAKLQIEKDIRADYSWHAEAIMYAQKQKLHGYTTTELASMYGKSKKYIEELLAMRSYADEYLSSRDMHNEWSVVTDSFYAFEQLLKAISETKSISDREIIKQATFALIDDDEQNVGERLYSAIPKVKEYIGVIKQSLAQAFPVSTPKTDEVATQAFGGPVSSSANSDTNEMALVAEIKKTKDSIVKARAVVIETIRSQDGQVKEKEAADFLLKTLKRAHAQLQNACAHGLKPESSIIGVQSQVDAIKESISKIEAWIREVKS